MKNSLLVYLLLISFLQSFSQVNLKAGLVAYYPFSGNANDASGNGNNPIFNNATLTNDRFGNPNSAYSFNGINNYIRIPNSSSLNSSNQISICAWVKVAGFYQGKCHGNEVVMKGNSDYLQGDYKIRFDDSYITNNQNCSISNPDVNRETFFGINSSSSSNAPFVQTDRWYSVVYTCDGTTAKIYVNCKLAGSGPANGITFTNSDDLFLGKMNNGQYPYWFNGTMDEIRIYNRAINEDEIRAYGDCSILDTQCNNWLKTPSAPSSIRIGQLNITGDKVTVEAVINRTAPYSGGQVWAGDVVSKHRDPTDVNYLLRPNSGEITTTNGYYKTPDIADIQLNKTYHIAMVYDGDSLKFYRDGCLMSEIKATGNLHQNSWETSIGYYSPQLFPNENFIGYINEVRIWNVARTQAQIQAYMNTSLPNPTTQPGLLAYYTFDNLLNKQGNASWNGTINGGASINQTNPSCNPIVNLCKVVSCNMSVTKSSDTTVCKGSPVSLFATGGTTYTWTPQTGLDNPNSANPTATPSVSTKYYVTVDDGAGCSKKDSVQINVNNLPTISKSNDTAICMNSTVPLFATGGTSYNWSPASGLDNNTSSNPKASPSVTTKYFVTVTNSAGCSKADSVKVTVNDFAISKSNDTSICENTSVALFAKGGTSYSWTPSGTLDNSSSSSPVASPSTSTIYHVKVTDAKGCSKNDSIKIAVNSLPVISKSKDTTICNNSAAQLSASGGSSYSWTPVASLNNPAIPNPVASPVSTTTYFLTVSNGNCSALDSVKVAVYPTANISISSDTTVCANSSVQLLANGGNTYEWSPTASLDNPAITNPVASPESTTIFHVSITDSYSCVYNDSVEIAVRQPAVFSVSPGDSVCSNTSFQLNASGGDIYAWSPVSFLDNAAVSNPIASPDSSITYAVVIKDITCKQTDTLFTKVTVLPDPVISATHSNDIDCFSATSQLNVSGAVSYDWSPATGLDNFQIPNPVASPIATTLYTVTGKDQNGCSNTDTVTVKVNFNGNTVYALPNSFTPNNDGLNDCFGVKYWGQVSELDFNIYNRFGERVFHTNDPGNCWDGTFKGQPQQADVFVYTIKAKTACGNIDKKGIVTLLR